MAETRVETISWAGGEGLFSVSQGVHSSYVHDVIDALTNSGFGMVVEEEISYFGKIKSLSLGQP